MKCLLLTANLVEAKNARKTIRSDKLLQKLGPNENILDVNIGIAKL